MTDEMPKEIYVMQPAPLNSGKNNDLSKYQGLQPAPQYVLDLGAE